MKEKKVTITAKGISQKQWSTLLLEFNLIKKEWKKFGVDLRMTAPGLERTLAWGTKKHNEVRDNSPVIE
jgi:hypothetical protein